jgi:hypothetical protein
MASLDANFGNGEVTESARRGGMRVSSWFLCYELFVEPAWQYALSQRGMFCYIRRSFW